MILKNPKIFIKTNYGTKKMSVCLDGEANGVEVHVDCVELNVSNMLEDATIMCELDPSILIGMED